MAENKTKATDASVSNFIDQVENETRRKDAHTIRKLMDEVTGLQPRMWGPTMVGYGDHHYKYESGREGDTFAVGFSPRKANLVLYISSDFPEFEALMGKLGKYKTSKACIYINKLADVDEQVLRELVKGSFNHQTEKGC